MVGVEAEEASVEVVIEAAEAASVGEEVDMVDLVEEVVTEAEEAVSVEEEAVALVMESKLPIREVLSLSKEKDKLYESKIDLLQ